MTSTLPHNEIQRWYTTQFPTDDMGMEISETATFVDLLYTIQEGNDVYEFLGVSDSVIRERLFTELANRIAKSYDFVYDLWLAKDFNHAIAGVDFSESLNILKSL